MRRCTHQRETYARSRIPMRGASYLSPHNARQLYHHLKNNKTIPVPSPPWLSRSFPTTPTSSTSSPAAAALPTQHPSTQTLHTYQSNHSTPNIKGSIELIIGPMFAGKSTELLRRVLAAESEGAAVALVKSQKDGRYSTHEVVTHDGTRRSCHTYGQLMDFLNMPSSSSLRQQQCIISTTLVVDFQSAGVIAIDEAQFFPDLLQFCSTAADIHGKRVIIAGLDGDFKRSKFGQILDLIPMADSVTKLTATCKFCEEDGLGHVPALFSLRLEHNNKNRRSNSSSGNVDEKEEEEEEQELVGGAESYAPACRHHFVNLSSKEDR